VIDLSYADERSVVQTRFPTTALTLLRTALGADAAAQAELVRHGEAALRAELSDMPMQLVVLATGWAIGLAEEAALKCREGGGHVGRRRTPPPSTGTDRFSVAGPARWSGR